MKLKYCALISTEKSLFKCPVNTNPPPAFEIVFEYLNDLLTDLFPRGKFNPPIKAKPVALLSYKM